MKTYLVRLIDSSERTVEAKKFTYEEHGVQFSGIRYKARDTDNGPYIVGFVPYRSLLLLTVIEK